MQALEGYLHKLKSLSDQTAVFVDPLAIVQVSDACI
jgi:hypothetical protein